MQRGATRWKSCVAAVDSLIEHRGLSRGKREHLSMMVEAIAVLLKQLNDYISQVDGSAGAPSQAVSGNIAQLDRPEVATELDNHIVLSLVNLEEERALKNGQTA